MSRPQKALFTVNCFLSVVLYALPFLLEKTARKHIMFYRYLITKQNWWAGGALYLRIGLTAAAILAVLFTVFLIKNRKRACPLPFHIVCIVSIIVTAVVMNINPAVTLVYFMLLIASWAAAVLMLLTMLIKTITSRYDGRG